MRKLLLLLVFMLQVFGCSLSNQKINGVSYVASKQAVEHSNIKPIVKLHANYAAIMPFGFIRELSHPEIIFNTERQWYGETTDGAKQYVESLKKHQIKIMIKPQLWVWRGEFTGGIKMTSEQDWMLLENSYSNFILEFAKLAQDVNAEIFCIGTELESFIDSRPDYWEGLITEIKRIYKGKLTYAANWSEYNRTPFWDQLDYIGIDAYFPVSDLKTPTIESCLNGWEKYIPEITSYSKKHNKQILFTEFGYRSMDYSGKKPWLTDHNIKNVNLEAQNSMLEGLFLTFWEEDWFAGGFVWKWFVEYNNVGGSNDNMFTPQNKPAEEIIRKYYKT